LRIQAYNTVIGLAVHLHPVIQDGPKKFISSSKIDGFLKLCHCYSATLSRKFAIRISLKIPPHLKRVASLPCEI